MDDLHSNCHHATAFSPRRPRVALVVSHPIQHFCPQYASLARSKAWDFKVFFASKMGAEPYDDKNFQQRIAWDNLYLDRFPHKFLTPLSLPSNRSLDAPQIDEELSVYNPDVVVIYGYHQRFQARVRKWAAQNGALIYYISDSHIHGCESPFKRLAKAIYFRRHFRSIHRVLSVGNANEFYYARHGVPSHRMTRMNFPIDVINYEQVVHCQEEIRSRTRRLLACDDSTILFAIVGKLVDWKRQQDAVEAIAKVAKEHDARLLVIGSGPNEAALRAQGKEIADGRVLFTGFVPASELPNYYAASDVYVHASFKEPHSLAISEAIYMALPAIISSRCGSYGPWDDVRPGSNGYVYATGDVGELSRRMTELAADASLRKRLGAASREYAVIAQKRAHGEFLNDALVADNLLENAASRDGQRRDSR